VAMVQGEEPLATALNHYDPLFTYGVRLGMPDCTLPTAGRQWLPTRPVVATQLWDPTPAAGLLPVSALMNWSGWEEVTYEGRGDGHKNREFERFIDLPRRTAQPFALAVGGPAPKEWLRAHGWQLVDPLDTTRTIETYRQFIAGSRADFGIAKHAY